MSSSDAIDDLVASIERQFLQGFDPFFHYVTLEAMSRGDLPDYEMTDGDGEVVHGHQIIDLIRKSDARRADHLKSLARVFRYFASETMILLLLSGKPFGPFARIASVLRNDKLNQVFADISNRKVPQDFSLNSNGLPLGFVEWLSHCISSDPKWLANPDQGRLVELVVEEAHLLRERGAINAFKHGKPFSFGKGFEMKMTNPQTGESAGNLPLDGISWIDWIEKRNTLSIGYYTEEIVPEDDKARLFVVSMLNSAIRDVRLAQINGNRTAEVHFPTEFKTGLRVRRQNLKLNVSTKVEATE